MDRTKQTRRCSRLIGRASVGAERLASLTTIDNAKVSKKTVEI